MRCAFFVHARFKLRVSETRQDFRAWLTERATLAEQSAASRAASWPGLACGDATRGQNCLLFSLGCDAPRTPKMHHSTRNTTPLVRRAWLCLRDHAVWRRQRAPLKTKNASAYRPCGQWQRSFRTTRIPLCLAVACHVTVHELATNMRSGTRSLFERFALASAHPSLQRGSGQPKNCRDA